MSILIDAKIEIKTNLEETIKSEADPIDGKKVKLRYRNWVEDGHAAQVYRIPYGCCRYRLENGRISIDITSDKASESPLTGDTREDQEKIASYLKKDPKNKVLKNLLKKDGQRDPAIITADGFLINGNRRRLIIEELYNETLEDRFKTLEVIILPGTGDPNRPTIEDIAMLEYREQVESDGKSDYSGMAKALTIRNNVNNGVPLRKMMRGDPKYSNLTEKPFEKDAKDLERDTIGVLSVVDDYLKANKIEGNYRIVESRWDSFKELSQRILLRLKDEKYLQTHHIEEDEVAEIAQACWAIMKTRNPKIIGKDKHVGFVRQINKWIKKSKKDFLELADIPDVEDHITDPDERERNWLIEHGEKAEAIIKRVDALTKKSEEQEGPIKKLEEILRMLDHKYLEEDKINNMPLSELDDAIRITNNIQTANRNLQQTFYDKKQNSSKEALKKNWENR
jgi:hypothetical protein